MNKDELLNTIRKEAERRSTILGLSFNGVAKLPAEIGQLKDLITLTIQSNSLVFIAPEIGKLDKLEKLELTCQNLAQIPPEIGQLRNLKHLSITSNQINTLPSEVNQLTNLKSIGIKAMNGVSLSFTEKTGERSRDNTGHPFLNLPSLSKLTGLETIEIIGCNISEFPTFILKLKNLTELNLQGNLLTTLPSEIAQMQSLRILDCMGNDLHALPVEIGQLKNLELLDASWNLLRSLPEEIAGLVELKVLKLMYNRIATLPLGTRNLKKLQTLDLQGNLLPDSLGVIKYINEPETILDYYFNYEPKKLNLDSSDRSSLATPTKNIYPIPAPAPIKINLSNPDKIDSQPNSSSPTITVSQQTDTFTEKKKVNPWKSGSFYLLTIILGFVGYFIVKSIGWSYLDIFAAFGSSITTAIIVGLFQLRNDDQLSDASFKTLISEFFKRSPFFHKSESG
jgi:Leucine-rich repeat (LRR) protein